MVLSDVSNNKRFVIENISLKDPEKEALSVIGIREGIEILVIGDGYLEGSKVIKTDRDVLLQLNPFFVKNIHGNLVKTKRLVK